MNDLEHLQGLPPDGRFRGNSTGRVNKMEAVRQVIAKHGRGVMPVEIVKLVKAEHQADMSADMASTYKSAVLRELGRRGKRKGKRPTPAANKPSVAPRAGGSGISLADIEAVKKLCDRLGAEKVRQLAQVLK